VRHAPHITAVTAWMVCILTLGAGCVSDKVSEQGRLAGYQQTLASEENQARVDTMDVNTVDGIAVEHPIGPSIVRGYTVDANQVRMNRPKVQNLTIVQAIRATLVNNPEIRAVSFDPAIARQEVTKAAGAFDATEFTRANYDDLDKPTTTWSEIGQSEVTLFESGLKQTSPLGTEWSTSYRLTRSWDDLVGRNPEWRFEPVLTFQLKQPLLRDGWSRVNRAGIDIARINYRIALLNFQQQAEDTAEQAIEAYWQLVQARSERDAYQNLLDITQQTLDKVRGRSEIDATDVQIRQAQVSVKMREAVLLQAEKRVQDAQDRLVRLMADPGLGLLNEYTIVPSTRPNEVLGEIQVDEIMQQALMHNPYMRQARARIEIADINIQAAENQEMPRLDLVASANTQSLDSDFSEAHSYLTDHEYNSYSVGLTLEIPLGGNRARKAELQRRRLERKQAVNSLYNVTDQIAEAVKERCRRARTYFKEIEVQDQATQAATAHLMALEDSEQIREQLTPEFLLVKLQAQDSVATAQTARAKAITDYNIALSSLEQIMGRILTLHVAVPRDSEKK